VCSDGWIFRAAIFPQRLRCPITLHDTLLDQGGKATGNICFDGNNQGSTVFPIVAK